MTTNNTTTLASRLKTRFKDGTTHLVPVPADMQRRVEFRDELSGGDSLELDISLALELGFTQGEGTLNGAIAQKTEKAIVSAFNLTLQSQVSYSVIERAKKTDGAFTRFIDNKFIPGIESMRMREEYYMLQGRRGLGVVSVVVGSGVFEISAGSWNATLWSSIRGATLEAFTAVDGSTQHNTDLVLTDVAIATRRITVTGTSAAVAVGDVLFFKGDHAAGRIGLMHIAKNTGTLFNISAVTYPLWAANAYDCGTSAISLGKILGAAAMSAAKGCVGKKLVCYVPVGAFQSLVSDEAALTQHAAARSKAENGFEYLSFMGVSGQIEVVPHLYMRDGEAILWPEDMCFVYGSTEAKNQVGKDGEIYFDLESSNYKEMRWFSDTCGVFCERPGWITYLNRSDSLALHT